MTIMTIMIKQKIERQTKKKAKVRERETNEEKADKTMNVMCPSYLNISISVFMVCSGTSALLRKNGCAATCK